MPAKVVEGEGNLVTVKEPKFLSLVGSPANKAAFKIVRSDVAGDGEGEKQVKPHPVRRVKRSGPAPILRMAFPVGYTDEQVTEKMSQFGLVGYNVSTVEGGGIVATRADVKSISPDSTMAIPLTADGIVATVNKFTSDDANPKGKLAVVSIAFRSDLFDAEKVKTWLASNGMEGAEVPSAEDAGDFIVTRAEVPEGEEVRDVQLEEGVTARIIRADSQDIPLEWVAVVNETAYGNWGWGQLDFAAAMADEEFSDTMDEALYRLRDVLRNILLYSSLPLAERRVLMVRALGQFQEFTVGVLDSLPRTVLIAVARSDSTPKKEVFSMTTSTAPAAPATAPAATPAAPVVATRTDATPEAPPAAGTPEYLKAITDVASAAASAAVLAWAQRNEPKPAAAGDGTNAQPAGETKPAVEAITRADVTSAVEAAIKPLAETVAKLSGTTVLRTDVPDGQVQQKTTGGEKEDKDVFRGSPVFKGLGLNNKGRKAG